MASAAALACLVSLGACSGARGSAGAEPACQAPFADLAVSSASAEDQQILREASEDFCAVLADKPPVHAKPDPGGGPSDGGTQHYNGRRYQLTSLDSLSLFGSFRGTARGPILRFDPDFASGTNEVSNIRVYPVPSEGAEGENQ